MIVQDLCKFQRAFFGLDRICNEKICKFALICKLYLLAESSVIDLRKSNISYSYHFMNWSPVFNKPKVPCCVYSISCSSTENSKNMLVPRVFQSERYRTRARTLALSISQAYFPTRGGTLRNMERGIWRHAGAWRSTLGMCILSGRGRHAYKHLKYIGGTLRST